MRTVSATVGGLRADDRAPATPRAVLDPQLNTGKYTVLADARHAFGFQNVAVIVKKSVARGPVPGVRGTRSTSSAR
jgi:hypothetical protein